MIDDMATRILTSMNDAGLLEGGAFWPPACDPTADGGGGGCDHLLYDVNATSADHEALALRTHARAAGTARARSTL